MKNIKFIGLMSAALTVSISSCTTDNGLDIIENNNEAGVFTIQGNIGDTQNTRATVKPEDGKGFTWQASDRFDLYQSPDWNVNTFTIVDGSISSEGKSASFTCNDFTAADQSYYAFYPQGFTKVSDTSKFTYTIPETAYTQSADNDTKHLKDAMIMVANGESADVQSGINFTHKTALFRFGIGNATDAAVTVKSVKLSSTSTACFAKTYSYTVGGQEAIDGKSKELNLNFGDGGIQVSNGSPLKAYALAIPADAIADGEIFTLEVAYNDNSTSKVAYILADDSFVAGQYYTFNINIGGATQITYVNINDFLHDETTALVKEGDEIVITGTGFGTESGNVALTIGGTSVTPTLVSDTEIRFNVPSGFSEGKISLTIEDGKSVGYNTTFKLLNDNDDITQYVLKNYKAPYTPDGDDMVRSGEMMKPLDWIVENIYVDGRLGFVLQLSKRNDKSTGKALLLQTAWGYPNTMRNGKIYQNVYLVPGKYKLTSSVNNEFALSGNAYSAVCNTEGFSLATENISINTLGNVGLTAGNQDFSFEFNVTEAKNYSIGLIATITATEKYVKVTEFKLEYLGNNQ